MDFDIFSPWVLVGLRGAVTLAGVMVLIWIGRVWFETQIFGLSGFVLGLVGLATALGGIGATGLLGMPSVSGPRVVAVERQLKAATSARVALEEKLAMQSEQILALEKDLSKTGEGTEALAGASRLVITGADPKTFKGGWILTYVKDDGTEETDSFEFVKTKRANAPLSAIKSLVDKDMWQRIQDGKVKARRGVILEPEAQTN